MFALFALKLCSCFGVRKKRKKPSTNMKEVFQSGSLASLRIKKTVRFKEDEDSLWPNATPLYQTNEDVKEDDSSAPSHKPKVVQGVAPDAVLVEGIKCRSQLKCEDRPGGCEGPGCSAAPGGVTIIENKQFFFFY